MPGASLSEKLGLDTRQQNLQQSPYSRFPFFFWTLAAWVGSIVLFPLGRVGGWGVFFVLSFDKIPFLLLLNLLILGRITRTGLPCLIQPVHIFPLVTSPTTISKTNS